MEKRDITTIAKEILEEHRAVFESLRDHDEGERQISTENIERELKNML